MPDSLSDTGVLYFYLSLTKEKPSKHTMSLSNICFFLVSYCPAPCSFGYAIAKNRPINVYGIYTTEHSQVCDLTPTDAFCTAFNHYTF